MIKKLKKDLDPSDFRIWYNNWVKQNAKGKVLDVGKSTFWDYKFQTIDINPILKPTFVGNIEKTAFPDNMFDVVLCNGMYEFVNNPQAMIDEVLRITHDIAIFGFVGKDYKPYREHWKFYEGKEIFYPNIKIVYRKDFNKKYHFIVCKKLISIPLSQMKKIGYGMI